MAQIPITRVRYTESQARQLLEFYLFASPGNSPGPPRGIAPDQVAKFLFSALKPGSPALSCERALEVMRFYEVQGLSPHLQSLLTGSEHSYNDIRRSAFLLQALADLGTGSDAAWAADYFDRILLRNRGFAAAADLLLVTQLALVPYGSSYAFVEWLRTEMAATRSSQDYGNLREIQDNRLPGLAYLSAGKKRLLATPPGRRDWELVSIYLMESDLSHSYLVTWAARLIRKDATGDPGAVYAAFGRVLDYLAAAQDRDPEADFTIVRAAQAITYLQGQLTPEWRKLYDASHPEDARNFLWDDGKTISLD